MERVVFCVFEMFIPTAIAYALVYSVFDKRYEPNLHRIVILVGFAISMIIAAIPNILDGRDGLRAEDSIGDSFLIVIYPLVASFIVVSSFRFFLSEKCRKG